jgi:hypothetical protein
MQPHSVDLELSPEEVTVPSHALSSLGLAPLTSLPTASIAPPPGGDRLLAAAARGNLQLVVSLVESGRSPVDPVAPNGRSGLHAAAANGHAEVVQYLAARGADVARTSHPPESQTPLHECISGVDTLRWMNESPADLRSLAVARELVARGAPVDAKDGRGDTAAHIAAREGDYCVLIFLLNHEPALLNIEDGEGKTLMQRIMDDERMGENRFLCVYVLNLSKVALKRDQMGVPFQKDDEAKDVSSTRLRISGSESGKAEDLQSLLSSGRVPSFLSSFLETVSTSTLQFQWIAGIIFVVNVLLEGLLGGQNIFLALIVSGLLGTVHVMKPKVRQEKSTLRGRKVTKVDMIRDLYLTAEVSLLVSGNILYISDVLPYASYTSLMMHAFYILLLIPTVYYLFKAATTPGEYVQRTKADFDALLRYTRQGFVPLDKFCIGCTVVKVHGVKHCRYCSKCVANFDHHCPYVSNCISQKNLKYFYLLIVSFWAYLATAVVFIFHFFSKLPILDSEVFHYESNQVLPLISAEVMWIVFWQFPGLVLFLFVCLGILFGVSWLLVRHTRQIALRISTYQMLTKAGECNTNISTRQALINVYRFLKH